MLNKKGLSAVVTTIILVALGIAAVSLVWITVNNLVVDKLGNTESCSNIFGKVELNRMYTCYNATSKKLQFSISIADARITEAVVSVSGGGTTKSYILTNDLQSISGLAPYSSDSGNVKLPEQNSGLTYISTDFSSTPDSIRIAPVVDGNQCEVADSVLEIPACYTL
jgi:hypothetical protein